MTKQANLKVVHWVGDDADRFAELMTLFFDKEMRVNQRASWAVGVIGEKKPDLIKPWLGKMLKGLENPPHDALVRNTMRAFQFIDIPEKHQGIAANYCFEYLESVKYPIAIRAFAMTVLYNIAVKEPDLMPELKLIIEELIPYGSAGIKSRGRKILGKIEEYKHG